MTANQCLPLSHMTPKMAAPSSQNAPRLSRSASENSDGADYCSEDLDYPIIVNDMDVFYYRQMATSLQVRCNTLGDSAILQRLSLLVTALMAKSSSYCTNLLVVTPIIEVIPTVLTFTYLQ